MQLRIHVILIKFPVKLSATKIIYVVDLQQVMLSKILWDVNLFVWED